MENMGLDKNMMFWMDELKKYSGKKVFVTGCTGFKGSWLCRMLVGLGAKVTGYALSPDTAPALYNLADIGHDVDTVIDDIRNIGALNKALKNAKSDIVFHLAAQPLVLESYQRPRETFEINVMGTVNLLEAVRNTDSVRSVVNITTDKVYENKEWVWGYREDDALNGYDPYSNSKSCSELVTGSYINSFFREKHTAVSTVRAGNVIGGGDFSDNRIIPDCVRAAMEGKKILVRNPYSVRPYQHVLEPLAAYLLIGIVQMDRYEVSGAYNIGPDEKSCVTTGELVKLFCDKWGGDASWYCSDSKGAYHEANFLKLDCSKVKSVFDWAPRWDVSDAVGAAVEWTKEWQGGSNVRDIMDLQIKKYMEKNV